LALIIGAATRKREVLDRAEVEHSRPLFLDGPFLCIGVVTQVAGFATTGSHIRVVAVDCVPWVVTGDEIRQPAFRREITVDIIVDAVALIPLAKAVLCGDRAARDVFGMPFRSISQYWFGPPKNDVEGGSTEACV
jgi:hypothetical protein